MIFTSVLSRLILIRFDHCLFHLIHFKLIIIRMRFFDQNRLSSNELHTHLSTLIPGTKWVQKMCTDSQEIFYSGYTPPRLLEMLRVHDGYQPPPLARIIRIP
jgi:hypothetical protein